MLLAMIPDVLSPDKAQAILAPHISDIVAVLRAGWEDWKDAGRQVPHLVSGKSPRTRASWVHDAMTLEAMRRFADTEGVHVSKKRGFLTLTFEEGLLVLRFKKFSGRQLRTHGIPTEQRLTFQMQQLQLDGMQVTSVVAGYLLDSIELEMARLAVVCPFGKNNLWIIDLEIPGAGVAPVVPVAPKDPTSTHAVVVESAHSKQAKQAKETGKES